MSTVYWVKNAGKVTGPYSASQLRIMACKSRISASDWISEDSKRWIKANRVKNLGCHISTIGERQQSITADARKYWLKQAGQVLGPYTSRELKKLAKSAHIFPNDEISKDREHWKTASSVKELQINMYPGSEPENTQLQAPIVRPSEKEFVVMLCLSKDFLAGNSREHARLIIRRLDEKRWRLVFSTKRTTPITLSLDEFLLRSQISWPYVTLITENGRQRFLLGKGAIEELRQVLHERVAEMEADNLAREMTVCPRCNKKKMFSCACVDCGYVRWGWMVFLTIGCAMGVLFCVGIFFWGLDERKWSAIAVSLVTVYRLLVYFSSRVVAPIANALKARAPTETNAHALRAKLSYELPQRGFGLLVLASIVSKICSVTPDSTAHIVLAVIFGLLICGGHLIAGFVYSIISLIKGKTKEALWGFFWQGSITGFVVIASIVAGLRPTR